MSLIMIIISIINVIIIVVVVVDVVVVVVVDVVVVVVVVALASSTDACVISMSPCATLMTMPFTIELQIFVGYHLRGHYGACSMCRSICGLGYIMLISRMLI
jgi:hypothetical protein